MVSCKLNGWGLITNISTSEGLLFVLADDWLIKKSENWSYLRCVFKLYFPKKKFSYNIVKFGYSPLDHICDKNIRMWSMETTD